MRNESHRSVQVIGVLKLAKGLLMLGLATGGVALLGTDTTDRLKSLMRHFHADPDNRYFQLFLTKVVGLSPCLPLILIGSFAYGTLFVIEGVGLLKQKRWAEYLTVIVTGSFLPLEGFELLKSGSVLKGFVIALNVAIVAYLIVRLSRDRPHQ